MFIKALPCQQRKQRKLIEDSHIGEVLQFQHLCNCNSRNKNSDTNFNKVGKDGVIRRKG